VKTRTVLIASIVLLVLCWIPASALAEGKTTCSNATLTGAYAFTESGFITGIGPVAVAGVLESDGKGKINATDTVSLNGQINEETLSFNYQVNGDCTGSAASAPGQEPAHFNFVLINNGEQVVGIHTDTGTTLILKGKQQFGSSASAKSEDPF
jgi:hypothetical protein